MKILLKVHEFETKKEAKLALVQHGLSKYDTKSVTFKLPSSDQLKPIQTIYAGSHQEKDDERRNIRVVSLSWKGRQGRIASRSSYKQKMVKPEPS